MSDAERTCARCGGTVAGQLSFCTHCGNPLAQAPPTYAAPPPTYAAPPAYPPAYGAPAYPPAYAPPPRRRRTGLVVLWVTVAIVLVAGGAVGGFLLLADEPEDDDKDHVFRELDAEPTPSEPAASASSEPSVSTTPEPSASPTTVQCWDGPAASLSDCTMPTGARGIRWVFPSMEGADCSPGDANRVQIWNCYHYLDDGTAIRFNYSQWYNFASAVAHYRNPGYRGEFREIRVSDGRYLWFSYDLEKAQYKAALAYNRAPWSVTIYADTEADRDAAIRDLLVMRPREQLRGLG